ncbi:MAG: hypothetical protein K2Q01_08035, partial [Rickettsiales bacterium]|nr:hypothetical protein [Rickettsiales bacterium]
EAARIVQGFGIDGTLLYDDAGAQIGTLANERAAIATALRLENEMLEAMRERAKTNTDAELAAEIAIKENTIATLQLQDANLERTDLLVRQQTAMQVLTDQQRDNTAQAVQNGRDATAGLLRPTEREAENLATLREAAEAAARERKQAADTFAAEEKAGTIRPETRTAMFTNMAKDLKAQRDVMRAEKRIIDRGRARDAMAQELVRLQSEGRLTVNPDNSLTLNMSSMRAEDQYAFFQRLQQSLLPPDLAKSTGVNVVSTRINDRRQDVITFERMNLPATALSESLGGIKPADMLRATAYLRETGQALRLSGSDLPPAMKTAETALLRGTMPSPETVAAMVEYMQTAPSRPPIPQPTPQQPNRDAERRAFAREMFDQAMRGYRGSATQAEVVALSMAFDKENNDRQQRSNTRIDVRDPAVFVTLKNLREKVAFINEGLSRDDPKFVDLEAILARNEGLRTALATSESALRAASAVAQTTNSAANAVLPALRRDDGTNLPPR